ncbi:TVP38/TMEM64 family protein [Clostridium malenominatum]|uniref:TVP38/TMEM64 family membrane protein n=1 Tax=Clostridium malenominatum TaxID=1539 RepID=A0ABN1IRB4_9CLOT
MNKFINFLKNYKTLIICISVISISIVLCLTFKNEISWGWELLKDKERFKEFLDSFGPLAKIVFVLLHIIQVIIFMIPGEIIEAAGGYVFGAWRGILLSLIGINIGVSILFLLTKKYKESLVNKLIPKSFREQFQKILSTKKLTLIVFLIYLLPGIPRDGLVLICGLSKIDFKNFMFYSTLGRMPALIMSSYYGQNIALGNKGIVIMATVIIVSIFAIGVIFKESIYKSLEKVN